MVLKHVVMWTLNDPADADAFAVELRSCDGLVPGMRAFEVGVRTDGLEGNCDVVLVSAFDDRAALDAYQHHPHHHAVGQTLGRLRSSRVVLDYWADPSASTTTTQAAQPGSIPHQGDWE